MRSLCLCLLVACASAPVPSKVVPVADNPFHPAQAAELKKRFSYTWMEEIHPSVLESWRGRLESPHVLMEYLCDGTKGVTELPPIIQKGAPITVMDVVHYVNNGVPYAFGCWVDHDMYLGCTQVVQAEGVWFVVGLPESVQLPVPCIKGAKNVAN